MVGTWGIWGMLTDFTDPTDLAFLTMWLGYPSSYGSTGFISSISRVLITTLSKSSLSTYTILFIKSVTPTPFSLALFLKIILISKLLIRGMCCPKSILGRGNLSPGRFCWNTKKCYLKYEDIYEALEEI